jgi:hypothetical protein
MEDKSFQTDCQQPFAEFNMLLIPGTHFIGNGCTKLSFLAYRTFMFQWQL